jgi:KDO2-lipid IV(A) lauroyltransferase
MNGPLALAALSGLARALPLRAGTGLGGAVAAAHGRLAPGRRKSAIQNLQLLLPGRTGLDAIAGEAIRHHGRFVVELLRGPGDPRARFEAHGLSILDAALARGRGVVLAIPHMGNWEIAGAALAARGTPVTSVAGIQHHPSWTRAIRSERRRAGLHIVDPSANGLRTLGDALARNEIVALHVDGDQFRGGVPVSFSGRTVTLPGGPARLALRHGAALVFGVCTRDRDGRHVGRVIREIPLEPNAPDAVRRATQDLASALEDAIREHPEQWVVFRPLVPAQDEATA